MPEEYRTVTDPEVDEFIREYRDGKHPLSPEFQAALSKMKPTLFAELRDIINRGKPA